MLAWLPLLPGRVSGFTADFGGRSSTALHGAAYWGQL